MGGRICFCSSSEDLTVQIPTECKEALVNKSEDSALNYKVDVIIGADTGS